jgi:membrane-bound ClpP family serine protease
MSKQATKSEKPLSKKSAGTTSASDVNFLFEKRNYLILLAGIFLLVVGFMLMMGGSQPPAQFDPKVIYGFRVTTLSSIVVVAGLLVVLYSIFAKHKKLPG